MLREILKNFCKIFCSHDWETTYRFSTMRLGACYGEKYKIFTYKKCKKCGAEKEFSTTHTAKW
jgi:hypothetical protein